MKIIRAILTPIILFIDFCTRPKPMQRSSEAQSRVDQEAKHYALYQFVGCPFCVKVRRVLRRLNIPMELRDATQEKFEKELIAGGGKRKVPCLRIEKEGQVEWMYESTDINNYLKEKFS